MGSREQLKHKVEQQAERMKQAEDDRPTLLAQTRYLGTLGFLLVIPVIAGAYLGRWLDEKTGSTSAFWTISLVLAGAVIGMMNVYFFIQEND